MVQRFSGRCAVAVLLACTALTGIGLSSATVTSIAGSAQAGGTRTAGTAPPSTSTPAPAIIPGLNPLPEGGRAKGRGPGEEVATPWDLPAGSRVFNPVSGREEVTDPDIARSVVLIGDSQSSGAAGVAGTDTWVQLGLAARGYKVRFLGGAGVGFAAKTAQIPSYPDAVESGRVLLPFGNPALVVVQGGGNDASQQVPDAKILANAARLLKDLKTSYPNSEFLFIGTLAKGQLNGGGRRTQVDALLAGFAKRNGVRFISAGDWLTRYGVTGQLADGVHLTAGGHGELAKALAGSLKARGIQGPGSK